MLSGLARDLDQGDQSKLAHLQLWTLALALHRSDYESLTRNQYVRHLVDECARRSRGSALKHHMADQYVNRCVLTPFRIPELKLRDLNRNQQS